MVRSALLKKVKSFFPNKNLRLGFPEDLDPRVHEAIKGLYNAGISERFFLSSEEKNFYDSLGEHKDFFLNKREAFHFHSSRSQLEEKIFETLRLKAIERGKQVDESLLLKKAATFLYQSVYSLSVGNLDCVVAGCRYTTKEVIQAGLELLEKDKNSGTICSTFLMDRSKAHQEGAFRAFFSDCGVLINPGAQQLASIAEMSLQTLKSCNFLFPNEEPVVAFLSFATHGSAQHRVVTKVEEAVEIFKERNPNVLCDGPLQFDAAFDSSVRKQKVPNSKLGTKKPNLYIFPDLNSGNIAYKVAQRLAGCSAYGPLLQGFGRPYTDLSRGATSDDIISATCLKLLSLQA